MPIMHSLSPLLTAGEGVYLSPEVINSLVRREVSEAVAERVVALNDIIEITDIGFEHVKKINRLKPVVLAIQRRLLRHQCLPIQAARLKRSTQATRYCPTASGF